MNKSQLLTIMSLGILLTACSSYTQKPVDTATQKTKPPKTTPKNPITVSIYNHGYQPMHPYQIVGLESVSKYNLVGVKRQQASILDTMRNMAAAMGGDAVIDIQNDKKTIKGLVIAYTPPSLGLASIS